MAGKKVGVLALQGAFREHVKALQRCGASAVEIRKPDELEKVDGLIIPGGESTSIGKLMKTCGLDEAIDRKNQAGMPIWGTCAGMILLAKEIAGMEQPHLGLMDMRVVRNGYGRQLESFETDLEIENLKKVKAIFIRAPYVERVWGDTRVMASYQGRIVMVQEKNMLGTAFHPELSQELEIHDYFLKMI